MVPYALFLRSNPRNIFNRLNFELWDWQPTEPKLFECTDSIARSSLSPLVTKP